MSKFLYLKKKKCNPLFLSSNSLSCAHTHTHVYVCVCKLSLGCCGLSCLRNTTQNEIQTQESLQSPISDCSKKPFQTPPSSFYWFYFQMSNESVLFFLCTVLVKFQARKSSGVSKHSSPTPHCCPYLSVCPHSAHSPRKWSDSLSRKTFCFSLCLLSFISFYFSNSTWYSAMQSQLKVPRLQSFLDCQAFTHYSLCLNKWTWLIPTDSSK